MKKRKAEPVSRVSNKIPIAGFHQDGIFETAKHFYTEMYAIEQVEMQDAEIFKYRLNRLYLELPRDMVFQMVVHNTIIPKEQYLKSVLVPQQNYPQAEEYNRTILDAVGIGCNNVEKHVYLVIGKKAPTAAEAEEYFKEQEPVIRKAFGTIQIRRLSSIERLQMLYHVFRSKKNSFGKEIDLNNNGRPELGNLKYMKMSELDLIAPRQWNTKKDLVDYTVLDEDLPEQCYSRSLFVNNIPREVSVNAISDFTSVSSHMLFSVFYHPTDAKSGFTAASEQVKKNTVILRKQKRETIQDKKNHTVITFTERKEINEDVYFHEAALDTTKALVASDGLLIEASVVLTLFADSLEELERNTEILRITATKYACSVKTLDMMQWEGFCSSMPLCRQRVNVSRFLSSERLAQFSPVIAAENGVQSGAFYGLNAINDNLIILNRKQGINLAGVITGAEHSGKTYQMKREILNALLTTKDKISLISCGTEYDSFIQSLAGKKITNLKTNPFHIAEGYGLTKPDEQAKELFLAAYEQAKRIGSDYPLESYIGEVCQEQENDNEQSRLILYQPENPAEYLATMEHLWNQSIEDKKNNITNWIFLDGIDEFLIAAHGEDVILSYLLRYLKASSDIRNVVTVLVQDAVEIMTTIAGSLALEDLICGCGYVKLLNQGPIERKKFTEVLNIPNALLSYITNVESSQGLIITPTSSVAFNDNFLEKDNEFTKICSI